MSNIQDRFLLEQIYQSQILSPTSPADSSQSVDLITESSVFAKILEVDPRGDKVRPEPGTRGAMERNADAETLRNQVRYLHTNPKIGLKHNANVNEWTVLDAGVSDKNKLDVISRLKAGDGAFIIYHDGEQEKILIRQKYGDLDHAGMTRDTSKRLIGTGSSHNQLIWIFHADGRIEERERATSGPNRVLDPYANYARGGTPRANVSVDYIDPARRKTVFIIPSDDFLPTSIASADPEAVKPYTAHPRYGYSRDQYHGTNPQLAARDNIRKAFPQLGDEAITGPNISHEARAILAQNIEKVTDIIANHDSTLAARLRRIQNPASRLARILTWIGQYAQPSVHQIARQAFNSAPRDRGPIETALKAEFGEDVITDAIAGDISPKLYRDADEIIQIFNDNDPSPGKTLSAQFSNLSKERQVDEIFKWVLRGNYIQNKLKALLRKGSLDNAIALGMRPEDISKLAKSIYEYRDLLLALTTDRGNIDNILRIFVNKTGGATATVWDHNASYETIHGGLKTTDDVRKFSRRFFHWLLTDYLPSELAIKGPEEVINDINFDDLDI